MSSSLKSLADLQRWMQAVIIHPGGVEAGAAMANESLAGLADVPALERMILPSRAQTSAERLETYHRAYYARLLDCLRGFFPTLVRFLGQETFDEFAFGYLQRFPSQSYTLQKLADQFVTFLRQTKPAASDSGPSWADFLIELAELEWTIEDTFDAEGNETLPALSAATLAEIPAEEWGEVQLKLNPALRLLAFRFPINDFYSQSRQGKSVELPAPQETWMAVYRRDFIVRRQAMSRTEWETLAAIQRGATLGNALEEVARRTESANEIAIWAESLANTFQEWVELGIVTDVC